MLNLRLCAPSFPSCASNSSAPSSRPRADITPPRMCLSQIQRDYGLIERENGLETKFFDSLFAQALHPHSQLRQETELAIVRERVLESAARAGFASNPLGGVYLSLGKSRWIVHHQGAGSKPKVTSKNLRLWSPAFMRAARVYWTGACIMFAVVRCVAFGYGVIRFKTLRSMRRMAASSPGESISVDGLEYERVVVNLPSNVYGIQEVTILEASAASQDAMVERALDLEAKGADGDPYGVVAWPAAKTVAVRLLQLSAADMRRWSVLELGAGTGLVSLTAALCGSPRVIATDFNPACLKLIQEAAKMQSVTVATHLLDITDHTKPLPQADLVLIADMLYNPVTGEAVARRIHEAVSRGSRVIIADSPRRPGRPRMLEVLSELMGREIAFKSVLGESVSGVQRHELISERKGKGSSSPEPIEMAILEL